MERLMSRTFVTVSLFLAASVGFATPARAQYNAPTNQCDLQRGQGGYGLARLALQDTPRSRTPSSFRTPSLPRLERQRSRSDAPPIG
jgi:hypothetical protein